MPAVSTKRIGPSGVSTTVSTVSRVVPGMSWTTARSSPMSRLNSVDLPDVRPADDGDGERPARPRRSSRRRRRRRSGGRADGHQLVEQIAGAPAVQRAHRPRVRRGRARMNSQTRRLAGDVVHLVGDHEHRCVGSRRRTAGHAGVLLGDAGGRVDHHDHHVGRRDRLLALRGHLVVEVVAAGHPAAGVDEQELAALPLAVDLLAVAGDARALLDDRLAAPEDAVHQGRLADVGSPDDGDHRQTGGWCSCVHRGQGARAGRGRRWRRPRPGGAGRPASVPSRKRPPDRQTSGSR